MEQDPIIQRAFERLQEISKERRELEDFIATYRKLAGVQVKAPEPVSSALGSPRKPASSLAIVDAAMDVLHTKGEPMKLGALFDALTAKGLVIGGKEPRNNLGAKLSADRRLKTYQGVGWWFADEPFTQLTVCGNGGGNSPTLTAHGGSVGSTKAYPHRLDEDYYEEGPDTDVPRPLHSNGAIGSYPVGT